MFTQISDWLIQLYNSVGLAGLFFATVLESFLAPIPSEVVLITAGFSASGEKNISLLFLMAVVAALGNYVGTLPFYLLCRFGAEKYLPSFVSKYGKYLAISQKSLDKAQEYFNKKGDVTVFLARLVPGVRSLIAFPAGLAKMNFAKYTFYTLAGSITWNILLCGIGYWAYDYKDPVLNFMDKVSSLILIVIILIVVVYVGFVVNRYLKSRNSI